MNEAEVRVLLTQIKEQAWEVIQLLNKKDYDAVIVYTNTMEWNVNKVREFAKNTNKVT